MARSAQIVVPGLPYHVTHRGNNRQATFLTEEDFECYLFHLREHAREYGAQMLSYCLMSNHVHHVMIPLHKEALAQVMGFTHARYTQSFNKRHRQCGHLWQGRFYSSALDASHLIRALCYVERNPVRAGIASRADAYRWSSAAAHITGTDTTNIVDMSWWHEHIDSECWPAMLMHLEDITWVEQIRQTTLHDRPLGDEGFIHHIEEQSGCKFPSTRVGRPSRTRYR